MFLKAPGLKTRMIVSFLPVILGLGVVIGIFDYFMIKTKIVHRAQLQVCSNLRAARSTFNDEIDKMKGPFNCLRIAENAAELKHCLDLDYFFVVERSQEETIKSDIVRRAFKGNGTGGVRIIDSVELRAMGEEMFERAFIEIRPTPMARPTRRTALTSAMAIEYAQPFFNNQGVVTRVIYGGKIVNRYFNLVDRIRDFVSEDGQYKGRPTGTVTIFQDDVRIATNVQTEAGERAIGTRVSSAVYHNVVEQGKPWLTRAFVVNDWYLTAYEPIRDVNGGIIGMLYVGILERPFIDLLWTTFTRYIWILGIGALIAVLLSIVLAATIARPITSFVKAAGTIAEGDLDHRVTSKTSIAEINELARSFNEMAGKLSERDRSVREANEKLTVLNTRYIDLVGMVSHELKGILSSTVLNTCSVLDGYLGEINQGQRKALKSVARNLEYFDSTVKNFLNLSRIEKGELTLEQSEFRLREDVIEASVESFVRQAEDRGMTIENSVGADIAVYGDASLIQMVVNNLLGNAIKYGEEKRPIRISALHLDAKVAVEVYNDGRPLTIDQQQKLFKRFSRLDSPEGKRVRGTGLGLFLCKEIVELHGGSIRSEPREKGNAFLFTIATQP